MEAEAFKTVDKGKFWDFVVRRTDVRTLLPYFFGSSCCSVALDAGVGGARGPDGMFAPPEESDLLIVSGPVTLAQVPLLKRTYASMLKPCRVVLFGSCACSGGPFRDGYGVEVDVADILPVDVAIPGCPPSEGALAEGMKRLRAKISGKGLVKKS